MILTLLPRQRKSERGQGQARLVQPPHLLGEAWLLIHLAPVFSKVLVSQDVGLHEVVHLDRVDFSTLAVADLDRGREKGGRKVNTLPLCPLLPNLPPHTHPF